MGQVLNDDTAVIERVMVVGFENGDFAKGRERRELWICLGGLYGFPDMLELARKPAFMGSDEAHAYKGRNRIAINLHRGLPSELVQSATPA
jgi:hypothetical protein